MCCLIRSHWPMDLSAVHENTGHVVIVYQIFQFCCVSMFTGVAMLLRSLRKDSRRVLNTVVLLREPHTLGIDCLLCLRAFQDQWVRLPEGASQKARAKGRGLRQALKRHDTWPSSLLHTPSRAQCAWKTRRRCAVKSAALRRLFPHCSRCVSFRCLWRGPAVAS